VLFDCGCRFLTSRSSRAVLLNGAQNSIPDDNETNANCDDRNGAPELARKPNQELQALI